VFTTLAWVVAMSSSAEGAKGLSAGRDLDEVVTVGVLAVMTVGPRTRCASWRRK
jgi:hypothetical protein